VEGAFRVTCENVLRLLRANKESLMAVLEVQRRLMFNPSLLTGYAT
jgi:phosphatidylinositol kinase/protein kinase (PI-3  family)